MQLGTEGLHNLTVDCQYKIKVELANGKQFAEPGVNACRGGKWTISDSDDNLQLNGTIATGLTNHDYRRICSAELQQFTAGQLTENEAHLNDMLARSGKEGASQQLQIEAQIETTRPIIEDLRHGGVNSAQMVSLSDETDWLDERRRIGMSNSIAEMRKLIKMHSERANHEQPSTGSAYTVCALQAYVTNMAVKH